MRWVLLGWREWIGGFWIEGFSLGYSVCYSFGISFIRQFFFSEDWFLWGW